jgi:hypothetical protein
MKTFQILSAAVGLAITAQAHMEMTSPAPFKSKHNDHAGSDVDYSMTSPLSQDGSNFPCKGYHSLMGTPAGATTADYEAGQTYQFTIAGGANHGGGSCQASLSYDGGSTWSVIHSYIGNCPGAGESSFDFTVPGDAPSGEAIFAWTWFNQVGNREMYMNCAAVNIAGNSAGRAALAGRPAMFVANTGNGCSTVEGSDVDFPNPGPDVDNASSKTAPPSGSCPAGGSSGGSPPVNSNPPADDPPATQPTASAPVVSDPPAAEPTSVQPPIADPPATEPAPSEAPVAEPPVVDPPAATSTSRAGGVFITAPPAESTEAPAVPTTLVTATRSASSAVDVPSYTTPVASPPIATPPVASTPAASPSAAPVNPPTSGAGAYAPGEPCTNEGLWNCIDGSQFQRCASGQWSALMRMATGTRCASGETLDLQMVRKRVFAYGQPLIRA